MDGDYSGTAAAATISTFGSVVKQGMWLHCKVTNTNCGLPCPVLGKARGSEKGTA
jgi:hypothetical protein